jgi:hypothetical protein
VHAEQQRPDWLAGGPVLSRDVAVEDDPGDEGDRGGVERLGQGPQRDPGEQLLVEFAGLGLLARDGDDLVPCLDVFVGRGCRDDVLAGQFVLHPQLGGLRDVLRRARAVQPFGVHRGGQRLLGRVHQSLRSPGVEGVLYLAAARGEAAVAVGQQLVKRGDLGLYGADAELSLRRPAFCGRPPFRGGALLFLPCRSRRPPCCLPLLRGSQPFRLRRLLLLCALGLFRLPARLGLFFRELRRDPAFLGRPLAAGPRLLLLLFQLGLLVSRVQLGEQRLTSGHRHLQQVRTGARL